MHLLPDNSEPTENNMASHKAETFKIPCVKVEERRLNTL